jgi:ATP-dependent helicase HrpA
VTSASSHPNGGAGSEALTRLRASLGAVRLADRRRFAREIDRLGRSDRAVPSAVAAELAARIHASAATVERLKGLSLRLGFDPQLPIAAHVPEIQAALERYRVIVVCGATGSGKSTQLPKICLAAGRGAAGMIGHTQPRRIAARALAARIAQELATPLGGAVGYQVRFNDRTGPDCRVKLMTDGILLKELASDRELDRYDTLIIDEAHERSLNIDLLLGVLKRLSERRPELKVIVTSATIDPQKFARFFGDAPVIEVSGRSFPVEVRYRPLAAEDEDSAELSLPEGIVAAVRELAEGPVTRHGDILVFLPGEKHIREAGDALRRAHLTGTEILPLYARLSTEDQERIFATHRLRRVVLATNVAETSLTVPGVRHVVDSGLARLSRYSVRGKVQRLPIEPIARASAEQRKGRCGREAEGVCIRLYSEPDFAAREEYTPPEILRTNLASVILQMAALGLGEPEGFPFLDAPDTRLVNDGVRLLQELKAMDTDRRVTPIGLKLAALPCDPRLGRMLLAAGSHDCVAEALVIAAFLAAQDPRERPADLQQQADERHAAFQDQRSDFIGVLRLWSEFNAQAQALSRGELRKWCRDAFLSFVRMREWQDLHVQLTESASDLGLPTVARVREGGASYANIHRAVLAGLLGSVGRLDERREYEGARGTRFVIAPGTPLAARPPRWVVAASLLETTRLYARMVAAIEPAWIEAAAAHLVKRSYSEPHWSRARGQVAAFESVSLYGLAIATRRRVNYGPIAPAEAHEIFVREALVAGDSSLAGEFLAANGRLRAEVEALEAKIRRRDVLADEQRQVDFYRARIPREVSSVAAFERWRMGAERRDPELLHMSAGDLMRRDAPEAAASHFPDELAVAGNTLPLRYVFEPGARDDGVTLIVPEPLVDELDAGQLAWLVPGMRQEKVEAVLRALPKSVRKQLVPVPEHARAALAELAGMSDATLPPFYEWMAEYVKRHSGTPVLPRELEAESLPDHLRLNIRVLGTSAASEASGALGALGASEEPRTAPVLAEGRGLAAIREMLASSRSARDASRTRNGQVYRRWEFGELPASAQVERSGLRYTVYPAIADAGSGVEWREARSSTEAQAVSRRGFTRLAMLALPQQTRDVRKRAADERELVLLGQGLELAVPLPDAIAERTFSDCFFPADVALPRSRQAFDAQLDAHRGELHDRAEQVMRIVRTILKEWRTARSELERLRSVSAPTQSSDPFASAFADIDAQLAGLLSPDFVRATPAPWLEQLPRYLKAVARRLARLPGNARRDAELASRIAPFVRGWQQLMAQRAATAALPAIEQLRWMLEEFRVSLYAQDLKTLMPVSEKRLEAELERARTANAGGPDVRSTI